MRKPLLHLVQMPAQPQTESDGRLKSVINRDPRQQIIEAAFEIIQETGDFSLPMRDLAARARVSLSLPYKIFGSKAGVISALIRNDQEQFSEALAKQGSIDEIEAFFDHARLGTEVFARKESLYRALYRQSQTYSGGSETEPAREVFHGNLNRTRKALKVGLIRSDIDPVLFAETMTDIFSSCFRTWSASEWPVRYALIRFNFGAAAALAGVTTEPKASEMRARLIEFSHEARVFEAKSKIRINHP